MQIIDSHAHLVQYIAGTGSGGELRSIGGGMAIYANGQTVRMIPEQFHSDRVTPEQLLAVMDENGVEKAVLLQGNFYGFQNYYTWQAVQKYPARFVGAASYDPWSVDAEGIRRYLFETLGFRIVKFEVSTGSGLMANHPVFTVAGVTLEDAYAYAEAHGLVFVIDIGKCQSPSWQPEALRRAVLRHPGLKFVVCHLLAANDKQEAPLRAALERLRLPNVWFDLASVPHNCMGGGDPFGCALRYIILARDILGADRLLFGTDLPSNLKEGPYRSQVDYIMDSPSFTREEKERIFYRNAQQVYFR